MSPQYPTCSLIIYTAKMNSDGLEIFSRLAGKNLNTNTQRHSTQVGGLDVDGGLLLASRNLMGPRTGATGSTALPF